MGAGRLVGRNWLTLTTPDLEGTAAHADLLREYNAREQELRRRYEPPAARNGLRRAA